MDPILVHRRQQKNDMLSCIKNVPWIFCPEEEKADFVLGTSTCALYLSFRYHLLNPEYIYQRMSELRGRYKLRILLCLVDVTDPVHVLLPLTSLCSSNGFTLLLSWTKEEAARYLETYKAYEKKSAEAIQERLEVEHLPRMRDALTTIRIINKTDVSILAENFGSLADIMNASMEELAMCNGIGEKKVLSLHAAFNQPFFPHSSKKTTD